MDQHATLRVAHLPDERVAHVKRREERRAHHLLKLLGARFFDVEPSPGAGAVDDDPRRPVLPRDARRHLQDRRAVGGVEGLDVDLAFGAAVRAHLLGQHAELVLAPRDRDDVGAGAGEAHGRGATDAARCAGDQDE